MSSKLSGIGVGVGTQEGYHNLASKTAQLGWCLYKLRPKVHMQLHLVSFSCKALLVYTCFCSWHRGLGFSSCVYWIRMCMKHQLLDGANYVLSPLCPLEDIKPKLS